MTTQTNERPRSQAEAFQEADGPADTIPSWRVRDALAWSIARHPACPAVLAVRDKRNPNSLTARCPFCGKKHVHGAAGIEGPAVLGLRLSDCYNMPKRDYIIWAAA